MNEKRSPHYRLAEIKGAFALPTTLNRTWSAVEGAEALGMSEEDVTAVVQGLVEADFYKSMTSHADITVWQDVYKPMKDKTQLYVKFTLNAHSDLLLISFKKA